MADKNQFREVMDSLMQGMDGFVAAKTVVGEPVTINDTIILPLVDVSFGVGAGAGLNQTKKSDMGGGGMGAKMTPSAVLVIQNGVTRLVSVKNQDTVNKVLDMVPGVVDRFTVARNNPLRDSGVAAAVKKAGKGKSGDKTEEPKEE